MQTAADLDSNGLVEHLLEELREDIFVFEASTYEIIYMNEMARRRCGWDGDEWYRKSVSEIHETFLREPVADHLQPLVDGTKDQVWFEIEDRGKQLEVRTRYNKTPAGRDVFISTVSDMTTRRELEQAKLDNFSELSHEMRTPLTSIKGALRLLEAGLLGDFSPEARDILKVASRNTERLLRIVNDILDFQKIAAGKVAIDPQPQDLVELARNAIGINQGYGWELGVKLELVDKADYAPVVADREQILQVIGNFVSNAIKYSPAEEAVRIKVTETDGSWRLSVIDHGPGIPEHMRDTLFDSYTSVKSAKPIAGTGLGLAISKKFIAMNGGEVGFTSNYGHGSEFYFDLPKIRSKTAAA